MSDHRVRLTDEETGLIVSALKARLAMTRGMRREKIVRLVRRLEEMAPGNPTWRGVVDPYSSTAQMSAVKA